MAKQKPHHHLHGQPLQLSCKHVEDPWRCQPHCPQPTNPSNIATQTVPVSVQNTQHTFACCLQEEGNNVSKESASDSEGEEVGDIQNNPNICAALPNPPSDNNSDWELQNNSDHQLNVVANEPMNACTLCKKLDHCSGNAKMWFQKLA